MKILIAASGSGGHLMPAIFIAEALKELVPTVEIQFVGSGRPLEAMLIDARGFRRHEIRLGGVKGRGLRGVFDLLLLWPRAFFKVWSLIGAYKPDRCVGVGGYASVLPVLIAFLKGIPTWIHEAEIKPGLANFFLSLFATKVSLANKEAVMPRRSNNVFTGHPVRKELLNARREAVLTEPRKILVLGGSQGAEAIDRAFVDLAPWLKELKLELWHQCRSDNMEKLKLSYAKVDYAVRVDSFIDDMVSAFNWSDVIVSRAGAGAVAEISVVNRPTIFVPYPHAQANHQETNALILVNVGKAIMIKEGDDFGERLKAGLSKILSNALYHEMIETPYEPPNIGAAMRIASGVLGL